MTYDPYAHYDDWQLRNIERGFEASGALPSSRLSRGVDGYRAADDYLDRIEATRDFLREMSGEAFADLLYNAQDEAYFYDHPGAAQLLRVGRYNRHTAKGVISWIKTYFNNVLSDRPDMAADYTDPELWSNRPDYNGLTFLAPGSFGSTPNTSQHGAEILCRALIGDEREQRFVRQIWQRTSNGNPYAHEGTNERFLRSSQIEPDLGPWFTQPLDAAVIPTSEYIDQGLSEPTELDSIDDARHDALGYVAASGSDQDNQLEQEPLDSPAMAESQVRLAEHYTYLLWQSTKNSIQDGFGSVYNRPADWGVPNIAIEGNPELASAALEQERELHTTQDGRLDSVLSSRRSASVHCSEAGCTIFSVVDHTTPEIHVVETWDKDTNGRASLSYFEAWFFGECPRPGCCSNTDGQLRWLSIDISKFVKSVGYIDEQFGEQAQLAAAVIFRNAVRCNTLRVTQRFKGEPNPFDSVASTLTIPDYSRLTDSEISGATSEVYGAKLGVLEHNELIDFHEAMQDIDDDELWRELGDKSD